MTTVEILRKAKKLLTPKTWWQGGPHPEGIIPPDGKCCAGVAIGRAGEFHFPYGGDGREVQRFHDVREFLVQAIDTRDVAGWNDTPGRTLAEIHDAFDRAIALASQPQGPGDGNG